MIGKSGTAIATSGVHHICRACSACHVRARLARAQPPAAWPACSWLVPSYSFRCRRPRSPACHARCRACRRHRRQFCSPQPWQLRARASSIRRRQHLTPLAGQRHQPLTARPNLPLLAPSPPAPPIKSHHSSLLQPMQRQHHVRGRADWRTCSQPCLPLPTRLDRPAPLGVSNLWRACWAGRYHCFSTTATTPSSRNRSCDRARRLELLLPNHQRSSLPPHPLPFRPYSLDVPSFEPPPPHTPFLCRACTSKADVYRAPMYHFCSCVMKHDR